MIRNENKKLRAEIGEVRSFFMFQQERRFSEVYAAFSACEAADTMVMRPWDLA